MKIILVPQRRDDILEVIKDGDTLILNGEVFDFSPLPDNTVLPASAVASEWFFGDITRAGGELVITLLSPHGANPSHMQAFPDPLIDVEDGIVNLPKGSVNED